MPVTLHDASPAISYAGLTEGQKTMGLELAGVGLTSVDYVADTVTPDALAADVFGLTPNVPVAREVFHTRIHPADLPAVLAEVDKLLDPTFDDVIDITHRTVDADGATRWVRARKRLYRDEGNGARPARTGVAAILDITAEKAAQERSDFLIRELQHRTGNIVAVVSTIARMVMRTGAPEAFLDRFLPRLQNLSTRFRLDGPAKGAGLRETVATALEPFVTDHTGLSLDGPDISLDGAAAQTYAMITHELATNAVKYGAWSRVGGAVDLSWSRGEDGSLSWTWRERGGPPVVAPTRQGFGTQVLERFATRMLSAESTVEYASGGLVYRLRVPAET